MLVVDADMMIEVAAFESALLAKDEAVAVARGAVVDSNVAFVVMAVVS